MCKFIDGPAAGVSLLLHRAPLMLRAVRKPGGNWDALDQLDDEAEPGEEIVAYIAITEASTFHLCDRSRPYRSGWYETRDYRVVRDQPSDADMRKTEDWQRWVMANRGSVKIG